MTYRTVEPFREGIRVHGGLASDTLLIGGSNVTPISSGPALFVTPGGSGSGGSFSNALPSISAALEKLEVGGTILVGPGTYDDSFTLSTNYASIYGLGPIGSVIISPSVETAIGATVTGMNCRFYNLDITAEASADCGTFIQGDGFRAYNCKFESQDNAGVGIHFKPDEVTGTTASLFSLEGCEFAWAAIGVLFDVSAGEGGWSCTQGRILNGWWHNCSAAGIGEDTAGGTVRNLTVADGVFDVMEDGTVPTRFISLNQATANTNTGLVTRCSFPCTISSGKNTVSTKILWTGNFMTGGLSTAQPS